MPVFIYNHSGLIEERPEAEIEAAGRAIGVHNRANPGDVRKLFVGPEFPPADHVFDPGSGSIRLKSAAEKVSSGEYVLPPDHSVIHGPRGSVVLGPYQKLDASGNVVDKTATEKIAQGLVGFDSATQKIVNELIVDKPREEQITAGDLSYAALGNQEIQRLRQEVEIHFSQSTTQSGYRLDNLARQKAALSMQYRTLPETDAVKADLLQKKLIYPDAICDEILAAAETVQAAYGQAKSAIDACVTGQNPVSDFEAIQLANYL